MNKTVKEFYIKNQESNYKEDYDKSHSGRIEFVIEKCGLNKIENKKIGDFGCGLGNFFKRLNKNNEFVGYDGATIIEEDKLCKFDLFKIDLEKEAGDINQGDLDIAICSEVIEHLSNPYNAICLIKKLTKIRGDIILTIPDVSVWHNTVYPALMYPHTNFEQFLKQMALPVKEYYFWQNGWKAHVWKCENAPWEESEMMFPKNESKFIGKTPLEYTNL